MYNERKERIEGILKELVDSSEWWLAQEKDSPEIVGQALSCNNDFYNYWTYQLKEVKNAS